jgi:hypothetical protein
MESPPSTVILVSALVALASFTGVAGAVTSPASQGPAQASTASPHLESDSVHVRVLEVENLSTSMAVENATIEVEDENGTETVEVDSASVELTNATVMVNNATADVENGSLHVASANVTVTEGTVEIQSDRGNRTIDLSDTNASVENRTVVLSDLTNETLGLDESTMENATISMMTVTGISGEASIDTMAADFAVSQDGEMRNVSVGMADGNLSVEGASMTLMNATLQDGTLHVEQVNGSVDSATLEAEYLAVLVGSDLHRLGGEPMSVEDAEFNRTDVEVDVTDLGELLEHLTASETAAANV